MIKTVSLATVPDSDSRCLALVLEIVVAGFSFLFFSGLIRLIREGGSPLASSLSTGACSSPCDQQLNAFKCEEVVVHEPELIQ